jgi:3-dehydroquinate synthase
MKALQVELGSRSYPIYLGAGLIASPSLISSYIRATQVLIVTNETIAPLYLEKLKAQLSAYRCSEVILPDGERYKTLETVQCVFDRLLADKHGRTTTIIALGGGVIGDMTGFAAACYQRGVAFIQIPTTLLAQVDSSVGGKTGVNHLLGKNMIGAFHQPVCVLIDTDTLDTLPEREFRAGLAEVIKYGLIADKPFFYWIEQNIAGLLARNKDALAHAIRTSCQNKAAVVAQDENETGVRALLNLGHTFGHAIESWQCYTSWLHGEAVAAGTVIAAQLSCDMGLLSLEALDSIRNIFKRIELPVYVPEALDCPTFFDFMQRDKKVLDGRMRLILLESIGCAIISEDAAEQQIFSAIDKCRLNFDGSRDSSGRPILL